MIELLKQEITSEMTAEGKVNRLRETLQILCLKILYDRGYFSKMAFIGGTALRVLYGMRRFSEDLDFSLINKKGYDFQEMISILEREFGLYGLQMRVNAKVKKTVQNGMVKFPGLLKMLGLSTLKDQNLSIKIELDSNPPSGWHIEETVVNKLYILNITHFNLPSLYATKLHACFFRRYVKGRDFYDLLWYLTKKTTPNYTLLNNAIKQTEGKDPVLNETKLKDFLIEKVEKIDFTNVRRDVERFLEDKDELKLLEKSVITKSIADAFIKL